MYRSLFGLGDELESSLRTEVETLIKKKEIEVDLDKSPVCTFESYCAIGGLAVKYSQLKVHQEEDAWDSQRRRLIRKKKGEKWIETQISNEYAQFIIGQQLAETNYFEEATEMCFKAVGISQEQAE